MFRDLTKRFLVRGFDLSPGILMEGVGSHAKVSESGDSDSGMLKYEKPYYRYPQTGTSIFGTPLGC